jgi:hypothetical protein
MVSANAVATQQPATLARLIEADWNLRLRTPTTPPQRTKFRLPVLNGAGGLVKGINSLCNKAMSAALDDAT